MSRVVKRKEALKELLGGGVSGGVNLLFNYIKNNPGKRVIHLGKELNLTKRTTERWLNKLKKDGKIKFKGSSKTGGYWEVVK